MKPKTRCMMWVRPSFRTYAYNLDVGEQYYSPLADYSSNRDRDTGRHPGALTFTERLHYKWSQERNQSQLSENRSRQSSIHDSRASVTRAERASSRARSDFGGHSGYYAQQLANIGGSSAARTSATTLQQSETTCKTSEMHSTLLSAHEQSLREGRQSMSRAVRRAESHAVSSGKDPRHVLVPRDVSDDICKKVADLRMTPIEGREYDSFREASVRGRSRVSKLEKELNNMISSNMSYRSNYSKSARQLAKEAYEAAESESKSSRGYKKTTVIESSKRQA